MNAQRLLILLLLLTVLTGCMARPAQPEATPPLPEPTPQTPTPAAAQPQPTPEPTPVPTPAPTPVDRRIPQTLDDFPLAGLLVLMGVCGIGFVAVMIYRKRKK